MLDPLLSNYKVQIIVANAVVFEELVFSPAYTLTFDKNKAIPGGPYRAFTIRVYAIDKYGNLGTPGELSVRNDAPTLPTAVVTPTVAGAQFKFSFPFDTDFRGYRIWMSTSPGVATIDANLVYDGPDSGPSVPLAPNVTYYYIYAAYDAFGLDLLNYSTEASFTTLAVADTTPPAVPTGLSLSTTEVIDADGSSFAKIRATWTANTEPDIAGYTIAIQLASSGIWSYITINGGANVAAEWNVLVSTSYDVKISAYDRDANQSAFSSIQTLTSAADTTAPAVPTWGTCAANYRQFNFAWALSPVPTDFNHFELYENTVNNSSTATKIADVLTTAFNLQKALAGLITSTTYFYWLKSVDNTGNKSAFSVVQSLTVAALGAPTITNPLTSSLITDVDGTQKVTLDVAWTDGSPGEKISYTAEISLDNFTTIIDTKTVTGLTARFYVSGNLLYYARIRGNDGLAGYSTYSSILSLTTTKDTSPPAIPTGITIGSAIRSVFLNWVNATVADWDYVNIYRNTSNTFPGGTPYASVASNAFVDTNVVQGTTYYYFFKSVDTSGNETVSPSTSVNATPGQVATSDITNFAVGLTQQYNATIALAGFTWTDNSPSAGLIAWSAGTIYYQGVAYAIVAGNTANGYVYFAPGVSTTVLQTSVSNPALTDAQFMVATNVGGTHDLAWNAMANALIGTAYIQNLAVTNGKINDLAVDKLTSGSITSQTINIAGGTGGYIQSSNYVANTSGFRLDGAGNLFAMAATIKGAIAGGTITIGTNAFNVDATGQMWMGASTYASAPFGVTAAGAVKASSGMIGGFTLSSTDLTGSAASANQIDIGSGGTITITDTITGNTLVQLDNTGVSVSNVSKTHGVNSQPTQLQVYDSTAHYTSTLGSTAGLTIANSFLSRSAVLVLDSLTFTDIAVTRSATNEMTLTASAGLKHGSGLINLTNGTSNTVIWTTGGVGAPTVTTRAAGTKLTIYPSVDATHVDYAIGISSSTMWFSVADATCNFVWYLGITPMLTMSNTLLTYFATFRCSGTSECYRLSNSSGYISFYNNGETARSGYLQANAAGGGLVLASEAAGSLGLIAQTGNIVFVQINATNVLVVGAGSASVTGTLGVSGALTQAGNQVLHAANWTSFVGTMGQRAVTIQSGGTASGGSDGDVFFIY